MKTIKIAQWAQINILYLPVYLAIECGLLEKAGYRTELILAGNDDVTFKTVASGRAHFGVGDPTFCAMKKNAKANARIIATIAGRISFYGITHSPVIPDVFQPADFVNLRLTTFPKPSTSYMLLKHMKETNKRLLRSMKIVESPIGEQFHMLAANKADIVMDIEPFVSVAESKGCRVVYSYAQFHGPFAFTGLYTNEDVIRSDPKMVRAMGDAISKAFDIIHHDTETMLKVARKYLPRLDVKILKRAIARLRRDHVWQKHPQTYEESWKTAISTRARIGEKFIPDIHSCIDNRFVGNG